MAVSGIAIVTLAILLAAIVIGAVRGLIRSVLTFGHIFISIALMIIVAPYVKNALSLTGLDEAIHSRIETSIETKIDEKIDEYQSQIEEEYGITLPEGYDYSDIPDGYDYSDLPEGYEQYLPSVDDTTENSQSTVSSINIEEVLNQSLPGGLLTKFILSHINAEEYAEQGVQALAEHAADYGTNLIMKIISALIIFVIAQIIFHIILLASGVVEKLPVIKDANRILGGILGLAIGLCIVWLIYLFMTLLINAGPISTAMEDIAANPILKVLYDVNPLLLLLGL